MVGRRPDGYHELQTVFQFLDLADELYLRSTAAPDIVRLGELPGVPAHLDLVVRAARLLQQASGCRHGVEIRLCKRLPMGGGLGGGSSDAATVLAVLNRLWATGLTVGELMELGVQLGADVPVFLYGQAAWGEGVGERLTALPLPQPWYLVVRPNCQVSTAAVFQDPELTRNSPRMTIRDFLAGERANDCLAVVRRRYPEVRAALDWLGQFAEARLTGTGACVFAAFDSRAAAEAVLAQVPDGAAGFVARGLNRSPLHEQLQAFDEVSTGA